MCNLSIANFKTQNYFLLSCSTPWAFSVGVNSEPGETGRAHISVNEHFVTSERLTGRSQSSTQDYTIILGIQDEARKFFVVSKDAFMMTV